MSSSMIAALQLLFRLIIYYPTLTLVQTFLDSNSQGLTRFSNFLLVLLKKKTSELTTCPYSSLQL